MAARVELRATIGQPSAVFRPSLAFFRQPSALVSLTFLILHLAACDSDPQAGASGAPKKVKSTEQQLSAPIKEAIAHVPVGKFLAGSLPGEPGRNPELEPIQSEYELGPFRIDAYPYPGDPAQGPRLGVTQTEAQAICAQKNGRLCTEMEWERACRGPGSAVYPTGSEPCPKDNSTCLSGFDVARMGSLPEWTASTFGKGSDQKGEVVTRGAPSDSKANERRCARRTVTKKEDQAEVGFRCCYGAPNAASLFEPKLGDPYRELEISREELSALLKTDERTRELARDVTVFRPEAARTVVDRGPGDTMGFTFTTGALEWQPARGSRFLVVAGRSGKRTSFVLSYFIAGNTKKLAGSFIMENEPGPIALAYADSIRPRLHFSSCWGCPGETGKVLFRPPEDLVMLQP